MRVLGVNTAPPAPPPPPVEQLVDDDTELDEHQHVPDWMLLPKLGDTGNRRRRADLTNFPPAQDPLLQLMRSLIMRHGEAAKAERTVSRTLLNIFTLTRAPPLPILRQAVLHASPAVKTVSQTSGAKTTYTPVALSEKQRTHYGIKLLLKACKTRSGQKLEERLAREVVDILQKVHAAQSMKPGDVNWSGAMAEKATQHKTAMVQRRVPFRGSFLFTNNQQRWRQDRQRSGAERDCAALRIECCVAVWTANWGGALSVKQCAGTEQGRITLN
ncbi:Ribosomal protein [Mycena kentingensis (nom. inval.)]|nr:Ribosomal protein [Mycena kentingensis (nom. inval.)]